MADNPNRELPLGTLKSIERQAGTKIRYDPRESDLGQIGADIEHLRYAARVRKLPIGIQDFVGLRQDGYLYVDKTEAIYRLVTTGKVYLPVSSP